MFDLPQGIDAGEAILAEIGIRPLLTQKVETIRAPEWERIGRMDRIVQGLARDLAKGQLDRSSFPAVNYDRMLDALSAPIDPTQISAMVEQFPLQFHDA